MATLYIAEKPSVGRALANILFSGQGKKNARYITNGTDTVTWAAGHILGLAEPEQYDPALKSWSNYSFFPTRTQWKKVPMAKTKEQLDTIGSLLKKYDTVVHTGDPDREGQLLIDEVLKYFGYHGTVKRLLLNAVDDDSIRKALTQIQPNSNFFNLSQAGEGRERADWEFGIMLTRCYTKNAERKAGWTTPLHMGRVKEPTLGLVVRREREIQNFHPVDYFTLSCLFSSGMDPDFRASYIQPDTLPTDPEGRVLDHSVLDSICSTLQGQSGYISTFERKPGKTQPPLPYSLDTLQVEANKKYHYSPKEVLATVQKLYEQKLVSYPRSDCNYIPTSQHGDGTKILHMLCEKGFEPAKKANPSIQGNAWNDKKITAHHAIIPTGEPYSSTLSPMEQNIYDMIALRYVIQFYPPFLYDKTTFVITVGEHHFKGSGIRPRNLGFKAVFQDDKGENKKEDENDALPLNLALNAPVTVREAAVKAQKTHPPKRFTQGTLLQSMTHIYRFMDPKDPLTDKMKEIKGLGTPATRDTIISELLGNRPDGGKTTAYLKEEKNELVPTDMGFALIDMAAPALSDPVETAKMELSLDAISKGQGNLDEFMTGVEQNVRKNIAFAEQQTFPPQPGQQHFPCPGCGKPMSRFYSAKSKAYFWKCYNPDCKNPATGRNYIFCDYKGSPLAQKCPKCGSVLNYISPEKTKTGNPYFVCPTCPPADKWYDCKEGKAVPQKKRNSGFEHSNKKKSGQGYGRERRK